MAGGWASLGLLPELVKAAEEDFRWTLPSAIQDEAIPLILGGSDVMASAETGSGKTAAFCLPILQLCTELKEQQKQHQHQSTTASVKKQQQQQQMNLELSKLDKDQSIAMEPNSHGLRIQSRDVSRWAGCRATFGASKPGRYTYSCKILDEGLVRVGWSTADASLQLGTDTLGFGYGGTGVKVHQGNYDPFPSERLPFGKGDIIECFLEIHQLANSAIAATILFGKNGTFIGKAFEIQKKTLGSWGSFFPTVCLKNAECEVSFDTKVQGRPEFEPMQSMLNILTPNPKNLTNLADGKGKKGPLAIVIEPTRDLAEQTYRAFVDLAANLVDVPVSSALLVGGINSKDTISKLNKNQVDVIVGTPPILASHVKKGMIGCGRCRFFVLDEADELIANDSVKDIRSIYSLLVAANVDQSRFERLQVCFFSATLHSKEVRDLSNEICYQPFWIDLRGKDNSIIPETVHHCFVNINPDRFNEKESLIVTDACHRSGDLNKKIVLSSLSEKESASERVKQLKPRAIKEIIDKFRMDQVLVFCRTNLDCDLLQKYFHTSDKEGGGIASGYSCRVLAGMRSMEERKQSLQDFKEGEVRILIATDVAARGIDIRELPFVINATLPDMKQNPQTYIHRAGRVGRADRMGLCISLVASVEERVWYCQKGRKPPCTDTSDYANGGNCIWYSEPECKSLINQLLASNNQTAFSMSYPTLQVPVEIKKCLETSGYGTGVKESSEELPRFLMLRSQLQDVIDVEARLQEGFWALRRKLST